jgi:hypothetical protein
MSNKFLDLFQYTSVQKTQNGTKYIGCEMLKDAGDLTKGDKVDAIFITLNIVGFQDGEQTIDETVIM